MLVAQSCLTVCDPMNFSVHGIFQARILEGCHSLLQDIFLTQGSNPGLLHGRKMLEHLSHQGSPVYCGYCHYSVFIRFPVLRAFGERMLSMDLGVWDQNKSWFCFLLSNVSVGK